MNRTSELIVAAAVAAGIFSAVSMVERAVVEPDLGSKVPVRDKPVRSQIHVMNADRAQTLCGIAKDAYWHGGEGWVDLNAWDKKFLRERVSCPLCKKRAERYRRAVENRREAIERSVERQIRLKRVEVKE